MENKSSLQQGNKYWKPHSRYLQTEITLSFRKLSSFFCLFTFWLCRVISPTIDIRMYPIITKVTYLISSVTVLPYLFLASQKWQKQKATTSLICLRPPFPMSNNFISIKSDLMQSCSPKLCTSSLLLIMINCWLHS